MKSRFSGLPKGDRLVGMNHKIKVAPAFDPHPKSGSKPVAFRPAFNPNAIRFAEPGTVPVPVPRNPSLVRRFGRKAAAILAGLAFTGAGGVALHELASQKINYAKERAGISQKYHLHENALADRQVLDTIERISKKHSLHPDAVLETLKHNLGDSNRVWQLRNRINHTSDPAEQERLENVIKIVDAATASTPVTKRLQQVLGIKEQK
ncbi:MAG: hypothetical protein WCW13_04915 [archaeon]|jgi:hypothetical protein